MINNDVKENMLYFNGVNGTTGQYDLEPMPIDKFAEIIFEQPLPADKHAAGFYKTFIESEDFGLADDRDPKEIGQAGWGVIFAHDEDPDIIAALEPLRNLRKEQAGDYYYEYIGYKGERRGYHYEINDKGEWRGESKQKFLEGRGAESFGPADPKYAPYYLLIVGDPQKIPFKFQYQLDVQYAVGRIHFRNPQEYAQYAHNVVLAETPQKILLPREAIFFGVEHDDATVLSANHLVKPLLKQLGEVSEEFKMGWEFKSLLQDQATKDNLSALLNGTQAPTLLFTASHGVSFDLSDDRQEDRQGALLCQDWKFGKDPAQKLEDCYFWADNLESKTNLLGLMAFHFACYSAGTPRQNDFLIARDIKKPPQIAHKDFVARLPQRLLLNGALAAVAHVERAWEYSISYSKKARKDDKHLATYRSTMRRLMDGHPVGSALEFFNERYGELSAALTQGVEDRKFEMPGAPGQAELLRLWKANNDARNYVIIGDPASRLPLVDVAQQTSPERPQLKLVTFDTASAQPSSKEPDAIKSTPTKPTSASDQTEPHNQLDYSYDLRDTGQNIAQSLKDVSDKMAAVLQSTVENIATLEVLTYTSDDNLKKAYHSDTKKFSDEAKLMAVTRIEFDGDISHLVPVRKKPGEEESESQTEVEIDQQLWAIHREMVTLAQTSKVAFIKSVAEIAGTLMGIATGK